MRPPHSATDEHKGSACRYTNQSLAALYSKSTLCSDTETLAESLHFKLKNNAIGAQPVNPTISAFIALLTFFLLPLEAYSNNPFDRLSQLSPESRDFMELGIEFARCDALFFSIYNGLDTKGFDVDQKEVTAVRQAFAISYPDQVEWQDFYAELIGFDRQYEMWYEYGDEYDFRGPNQQGLFRIFFVGALMTMELERAVSNQIPQAHFDLFLSRREEAFRGALMKSGARHAEVHSKTLECIDLASFWGIEARENDSNPDQAAVSENTNQEPDCSTASRVLDNLRERRSITADGLRTWLKLYDGCAETEEVEQIIELLK